MNLRGIAIGLLTCSLSVFGQDVSDNDSLRSESLGDVTVTARPKGRVKGVSVTSTEMITASELLRAACCNLGESFTTNPSVDVNYADAATGAQQIKLLGLSGTYVQM